ncbi:hypothetical protein ACYZT2_13090 [Pseudomonas sp. MDT1-85]
MPKDAVAKKNVPDDSSASSSNVVYTAVVYDELNPLDRIARFIMAVAHSANYAATDREQGFIGQRTLAVALSKGTLYVAQNNVLTTRHFSDSSSSSKNPKPTFTAQVPELQDYLTSLVNMELEWEYAIPGEEIHLPVPDSLFSTVAWVFYGGPEDTSFHAEMQLVNFLHSQGLPFDKNQIGVSKPCCSSCASRLTQLGIDYSYFHTQRALPWIDPGVHARWW